MLSPSSRKPHPRRTATSTVGKSPMVTEKYSFEKLSPKMSDFSLSDDTQRNKANCPTTEDENQVQCGDGSLEFIPAGTLHSQPGQCEESGGIVRCPPNVNRLCIYDGRLVCNASDCIEEAKTCPTIKEEKEPSSLEASILALGVVLMATTLTIALCWFRKRKRQLVKVAPSETTSLRRQPQSSIPIPSLRRQPQSSIPIPRVNQVVQLESGVAQPLPSRAALRHNSRGFLIRVVETLSESNSPHIEESTEGPYMDYSVTHTPNMSLESPQHSLSPSTPPSTSPENSLSLTSVNTTQFSPTDLK